jgi:hypothetical protein
VLGTTSYVYDLQLTPACTPIAFQGGSCPIVVLGSDYNTTGDMLIWSVELTESTFQSTALTPYHVSDLLGVTDTPRASIFDSTGNLLITGYSALAGNNSGHVFFLIRASTASGYTLDTSFGNLGYAANPFTTFDSAGFAITLDPFQRILVGGGFTGNGTGLDQVVLRYLPNGSLDQSFGPYQGLATNAVTPLDDVVTGIYYDSANDRILTLGFAGGNTNAQGGASDGGTISISAYSPQ